MAATKLHSLPPQVDELKRKGISSVIPLFDGKKPGYSDWQRIDDNEAKSRFWAWDGQSNLNFGIRLGPAFGNLVDIDLDSEESRRLWKYFFPESLSFGRGGRTTHVLFKQVGTRDLMDSKRFLWDKRDEKSVLLEVRFSGQTMAVGSTHPDSGEKIEWTLEVPILEVTPEDLRRRSGMLAAAAMLLRDWTAGWRDEVCVCLAGAMLRAGWNTGSVDHFFESIAGCADDEELEGRLKAERLERLLANGGRVPGLKKLSELVSAEMGGRLIEWLELRGTNLLDEMNERHALVRVGGSVYILDEDSGELLSRDAFSMLWANRVVQVRGREVTADKFWLGHENRREYPGGLDFAPAWRGMEESEWLKRGAYNLWKGWGVQERVGCGRKVDVGGVSVGVEWSAWANHVFDELCWGDQKVWRWVYGWLSHRVRRPWEPPGTAIVMIGERGDGKGTIASIFGRLFGRHYMSVTQPTQLMGKFNSHLEDKVFVFADEATWGGDKVGEGVLKVMITEDRRVIERKGKEAYTVDNCVGYMVASNHDWVVPVGRYERRFFVSRMRGRRRGQWEYFEGLRRAMIDEGGCEVMLHELRQGGGGGECVSGGGGAGWRVGELVTWSKETGGGEGLAAQWLESASSGEKWIVTWLVEWANRSGWGSVGWIRDDHMLVGRGYLSYVNWCHTVGIKHPMTEVPFAKLIRKMLPVSGVRKLIKVSDGRIEGREYGLPLEGNNPLEYFERAIGINL